MPTVRELVRAIRQRPGIDAAVVTGRDGLVIAADVAPHVDPDELSARVPSLIAAADEATGGFTNALFEHAGGYLVVVALGAEAALCVVAKSDAELAPLVSDLRRFRDRIAELV